MKTLEEYILSNNIIEQQYDFIDRDFIDFFNLQWCLNHSQIKEQIYESDIIYDGQIEQATVIDEFFQKNRDKKILIITASQFKNIENVFFDSIYLHIYHTNESEYAVYKRSDKKYNDYNEIRWDINNKRFKFIEISVYINKETESIYEIILHELKHYFDDYNGFKNCKTILDIAASNPKYSRFIVNYKEDVLIQNVKQINNMFTKIEQNAYIGQLIGQITKLLNNKKYHSIDEAIKELIKTPEYNKYKTLKLFIIHILNNKDLQQKYIKTYKEITHTSLSDEKIISQLEYKFNKFWFALQKGIYQYIENKHLIKESVLQLSTKTFIKA